MASLWNVADDSTAELMTRFYGYLKDGMSKDEVLRAAQRDPIRSEHFAQPFMGGVHVGRRLALGSMREG